jgi:hypothetical protein
MYITLFTVASIVCGTIPFYLPNKYNIKDISITEHLKPRWFFSQSFV